MILKNKIKAFLPTLLILSVYFLSRLQNLTALPVFGDEAIYLRWSQVMKNVETLRFLPLTDGKQPLFMWLTIPFFKLTSDPLVAGRLLSMLVGIFCAIGIGLISIILVSQAKDLQPQDFIKNSLAKHQKLFIFGLALYIFIPFFFFFDRMALPDGLLSMFGVWSLFFSLLQSKFPRLDISMVLGIVLGLAWITKSPAIIFMTLIFFNFYIYQGFKPKKYVYPLISAIVSYVIYNLLRLGPQFQMIAQRNKDYIWTIGDIFRHPLDPLLPHLGDIISVYRQYFGLILFIIPIAFITHFIKNKKINSLLLIPLAWWILPLVFNLIFAKVFTARYALYTVPPLMILLLLSISFIIKTKLKVIVLITKTVIFVSLIINTLWIIKISLTPMQISLPSTESGYLNDWTSGWGIKDSADYLKQKALTRNVIVGTEGYFGTLPDGLQIYTNQVSQITVFGVGLGFDTIPPKLVDAKNHGDDVYLLINRSRLELNPSELYKITIVKSYPKPNGDQLLLISIN